MAGFGVRLRSRTKLRSGCTLVEEIKIAPDWAKLIKRAGIKGEKYRTWYNGPHTIWEMHRNIELEEYLIRKD